jgi:hypothetical protein
MPTASSTDLAIATAKDLVAALLYPSSPSPLPRISIEHTIALKQLASISATTTIITPTIPPGFAPLASTIKVFDQATQVAVCSQMMNSSQTRFYQHFQDAPLQK